MKTISDYFIGQANTIVQRAEGLYLWLTGQCEPYIDLVQGYSVTNWGHRHPRIVNTAHSALLEIDHITGFFDPFHDKVCASLLQGVGFDGGDTYFDVGGAQIVNLAIHAAMTSTGRKKIACLSDSFHGFGCTGNLLSDAYLLDNVPRRECGYTEVLTVDSSAALTRISDGDLAAVVIEPIQGAAGFQKLPIEWAKELSTLCKDSDTLLISDEIQVGLGRAGSFSALEQIGIKADAYLFGKALGGGIFPISAIVARTGILPQKNRELMGLCSTFSDNQLGIRIAHTVLALLNETLAQSDISALGQKFCESITRGFSEHTAMNVRSCGMAIVIDFDSSTNARRFWKFARKRRVLTQIAGVLRNSVKMFPPLNIKPEEINEVSSRLREALAEV